MNDPDPQPKPTAIRALNEQRVADLSARARRTLQETARQPDRGELDAAQRNLTAAMALAGEHVECLRLEGLLLQRRGRLDEAMQVLIRAAAKRPDDALILASLGGVQFASHDFDTARATLGRACALSPDCAFAWSELAKLLDTQGHTDAARSAFERFLKLQPGHLLARVGLAGTLKALGRIDESAAEYRRVITRNKRMYQAWFSLVDLKTVPLASGEIAELARLAADPGFQPLARASLAFALGKVREDDGRQNEAFAAFERANSTMRGISKWNAGAFSRGVDAVITTFGQLPVPAAGLRGEEVIFIVSLPRSGSTLVEQILAAHPHVEGASELPDLSAVLGEESARRDIGFPQSVATATATDADWQRLGERYLQRTARWRERHPRSTDKMPSNWRMLGAA